MFLQIIIELEVLLCTNRNEIWHYPSICMHEFMRLYFSDTFIVDMLELFFVYLSLLCNEKLQQLSLKEIVVFNLINFEKLFCIPCC